MDVISKEKERKRANYAIFNKLFPFWLFPDWNEQWLLLSLLRAENSITIKQIITSARQVFDPTFGSTAISISLTIPWLGLLSGRIIFNFSTFLPLKVKQVKSLFPYPQKLTSCQQNNIMPKSLEPNKRELSLSEKGINVK